MFSLLCITGSVIVLFWRIEWVGTSGLNRATVSRGMVLLRDGREYERQEQAQVKRFLSAYGLNQGLPDGIVGDSLRAWDGDFIARSWPWPSCHLSGGIRAIVVPLWIPFLLVVAPTTYLWYRDRRRPPPGHCRSCHYNLTGNVSGVCPECGEKVRA